MKEWWERTVRPATVSSLKMFPITTAFTSLTSPYWILSKVLPNPILRLTVMACTRCAPSWSRCSSYLTGFSAWCSARPSPAYPVSDRESEEPGELMRENLNCAVTRRPHPALDLLLQMEIIVKFYNSVLSVGFGWTMGQPGSWCPGEAASSSQYFLLTHLDWAGQEGFKKKNSSTCF